MGDKSPYDVFISYSSPDRDWARTFAAALRSEGVNAWFDQTQLEPGERWQERIQEALRESRTLLLILSKSTVRGPWMFFELGAAVAGKKRVIPVIAGDVDVAEVPVPVRQYQFLNEPSPERAAKRVAETLSRLDAA
jgi:hypothetical protein